VAVSAATYAIDKPYTYLVPDHLAEDVKVGCRCVVPFGPGNRRAEGVLLRVWSEDDGIRHLKPLLQVLDEEPVVDKQGLQLALWMRDRYFCTLYDAIRAMLPSGLYYALHDQFTLCDGVDAETAREQTASAPAQRRVVEVLLAKGGSAERKDIYATFKNRSMAGALRQLQEKGLIRLETSSSRGVGDKTEQVATLTLPPEEALRRLTSGAKSQRAVINLLAETGSASIKDITYFTGAKRSSVKTLADKGLITLFTREVFRRAPHAAVQRQPEPVLNEEQEKAYQGIVALLSKPTPACALLYGVTGSGKTAVYLKLIHWVLGQGKTALVLVPEIALTPQMLQRFEAQFGDRVAVLHSALPTGARYDEWKRIRAGRAQVVIGTRSAVFAPLKNLGLIVLDEEHEGSYKSEQSPRYHARDVAKYRCKQTGATLLLGSATPSIESTYWSMAGRYEIFVLRNRYNAQALPQVHLVDMKEELRSGNSGSLSRSLKKLIGINLERGEQTILFLNRRGTSRMVVCSSCGYTPECPNCTVKLTYHRDNQRMMCHYCGHSAPVPTTCPSCGGNFIYVGVGIQKVEEEVQACFPGTPVLRMDADTVSATNTHEQILNRFQQDKVPILIGTQMVTKGLDFDNVTLVGVIDADLSLCTESYRASERTFSLLTQVVGRAGRGDKLGKAVIQTYSPKNEVLQFAAQQDYAQFYHSELALRIASGFPPLRDLFVITCSGVYEQQVVWAARKLGEGIRSWLDTPAFQGKRAELLGPVAAPVARVMGKYRYRLTLVCRMCKEVRQMLACLQTEFMKQKENRGLSLSIDCNPMD
jgi:primosomal protein N' (replication factor Y)